MSDKNFSVPLTELDKQTYYGPSQLLKAAVSYMDPSSGKMLAMLARMLEFRQTMNLFNEERLSVCSLSEDQRPGIEEVLKDIRKYCSPNEAEQIDQFLNLFNAVRLYQQYSELTQNSDFSAMMNSISQFKNIHSSAPQTNPINGINISPEQIQMLQNLLHSQSSQPNS